MRSWHFVGCPMSQGRSMLCAYFDDSGTHKNSDVVVMGGLIGTPSQWEQFEVAWAARLACPLPGKPALRVFHLSHCQESWGEFRSYSRAESDAITYDFRQIIINSDLISTSSAVDRRAWDELVLNAGFSGLGSALEQCVQNCIVETNKIANPHPEGDDVIVVFDRGIWSERISVLTEPFTYPLGRPRIAAVRSLTVTESFGLQGADMAATECYWHARDILRYGLDAAPRAHLQHYLANMKTEALILGRPEIEELVDRHGLNMRSGQLRP